MCNCTNMARTLEETQGGRFAPSKHSPACEDFESERFVEITINESTCIMEPHEARGCIEDETEFTVNDIYLTRDQFDNLKEFEGW